MPAPLPHDGRTLTHAGLALVTHRDGSIHGDDASGLYAADRRILRGMRFEINGDQATLLSGSQTGPWSDRIVYGSWRDGADPAALITRERRLDHGYRETITVTAFGAPVDMDLRIELEPGGATVYHLDEEDLNASTASDLSAAIAVDGLRRDGTTISGALSVPARGSTTVQWSLALGAPEPRLPEKPEISSSNPLLQRVLRQAAWDLDALTVLDPKTQRPFTAAGAPHFLAVFGRDALLSSLLALSNGTDRALDTLEVLAAHQGTVDDPHTLEEPGRILHELRIGEMGVFGIDPGTPYYGSIDATPLFIVVLRECLSWGATESRVRALLPAARAAIDWCRRHVDDLGFVQSVPDPTGIANQSWKDSGDSMVRPDGSVIEGPTSPVEVQGYVHAALLGLADLEDALGDATLAVDLRAEADDFKQRFTDAFITTRPVHVHFVLDEAGQPMKVRSSNASHLLATSIIDDRTAHRLAARMLDDEEFSGWGLRTLATDERAYNPLGYHVGTVWPHDTALFLRGLTARGMRHDAKRVADALIELAVALDGPLPELLGGFSRDELADPAPYPASARPQAWAAAVPFQIVTSLLGMRPQLERAQIRFDPILPDGQRLTIRGLRLGGRMLDIDANGREVRVDGDVRGLTITTPAP